MITKRFAVKLDIKKVMSNREIEIVEGDNGNFIDITLTDNGQPVDLTGCRVIAVFCKSNGTSSQDSGVEDGGVTIDENTVSIELFLASFALGLVECELQIYSGEDFTTLVTSAKFNFKCRRAIFNEDTALSTEEYPLLVSLIQEVEILQENAEGYAEAEAGRVTAESGRVSAEEDRQSLYNSIFSAYNEGEFVGIEGPQGPAGESAYAAAVTGGYTGTDTEFYADLAAVDGLADALAAL